MSRAMSSSRLRPLQRIAELREDEAAKRLLDQRRVLGERELRLQELTRYLAEYEGLASAQHPRLLMNRQAFIERLREAVALQAQLVEQARSQVEAQRAEWLLQHREVATLDRLADCYRRRERRIEEQRSQRQLDEFALARFVAADTPP
ncbi:flagellar export protein FliJ [Sinimarinibacterium thermocellulolyticum]|uniref:Flagellar FliJ protein n=1 Tax=Sinimarinibacterium thermocellulolyticum TaxID=3170016 RepID=A0ABV2AA09_9GAMM